MSKKATKAKRTSTRTRSSKKVAMPFTRTNYLLILAGLACVVVGYTIMRLENEMDGFISLYIAPLLILFGYLEVIYAVVWKPKEASG